MTRQILILFLLYCIFATGCQNGVSSNSAANEQTAVAYYFHRTMRCPTCLAIEVNAQRVIKSSFAEQIAANKLMWIPYNLDEADGDQLEKEFDVSVSTLVLAKMQDGNHTNYKKLEKVWDFIGDPVKFDGYIKSEVEKFLNE